MTNPTYKVVSEKKFGFKKLFRKLIGKGTSEQDRGIKASMNEFPEGLKVVVGKADEDLLNGKSAVVEIGGFDGLALKKVMETYNQKYGRLPQEIYAMPVGETEGYLKVVMEGYEKNGINILSEIEAAITERRPFIGPHSKGTLEDGYYKVYVAGDLIYDGKEDAFDSEWKRSQIYSEIQHMVANHIYKKDLKTIRKESQKGQ
jgi:hypothetical protein